MNKHPVFLCRFIAAGMIIVAGWLGTVSGPLHAAENCDNPPVLHFSVVPEGGGRRDLERFRPMLDRLARETGKPVEVLAATSYAMVIEGLLSGAVDFAMLGPASYIAAHRTDPGINAFASLSRKPGIFQEDGAFYRSLLVVSAHSAKRSVEALRGASLAVVDPNSTSGMIIPRHYLAQEFKVKLNDHFGRVVYTGNHPRSAMLVHDGHVDAAFVSSYQLSEVVAAGKAKAEDFLVLWKSPRIPMDPFVMRSRLCQPLQTAIRKQFLSVPPSVNKDVLESFHAVRFFPISDHDYDVLRPVIP